MPVPSEPVMSRRQQWAFIILLAAATFLAYQPVWHAGFIWDDNMLLMGNPMVKQGDGWWRVWCAQFIDYIPAVSFSWWLEWRLWQYNPPAYHLVNVLWHVGDALLLWRVLLRLRIPGAGLAAAIFALHPVNVETAAWVAEQKNTQGLFFFLGAIWCHLQFEDTGGRRWYGLALGAFALSLASKTAAAPLPLVLLWLAWWRRGRVARLDFLRSIPFFILPAVDALFALSGTTTRDTGFFIRLARAGETVWFYLYKALLPVNLVSIYPKWSVHAGNPLSYVPGLLFIGLLAVLWRSQKSWARPLLFGLGYFVLMLLPVLGFFDITLMRYAWVADHWQYFAIIGPIALLAAAVHMLQRKNALAGLVLAAFILTVCGLLTWRQARIYKSGDVFWAEFMKVNQPAIADYDAGRDLLSHGKPDEAMALFRQAIDLQPAFSLPYNSIASLLLQKGLTDEALPLLQEAITLRPDFPEAQENLGKVLLAQGRTAEALEHFQRSADLQPREAGAQYNFGRVLLQVGLPEDALDYLQKATALRPDFAEARYETGNAFEELGRFHEAIASYEKALDLRPNFIPVCNNLAWLLATAADPSLRNGAKAIALAQRADQLSGDKNPLVLGTLAAAYAEARRFPKAIATAQRAVSLADEQGNLKLADALRSQIKQYQGNTPLRQANGHPQGS
jgi:protein O-mannosyl-transferase